MRKKFKLTKETIEVNGRILYRIKALKTFGNVKKGDLGGFVEKEENLSHEDNCWIDDNACVYGHSYVRDDAYVRDHAGVYNSYVSDSAIISGYSYVNDSQVCECAVITDHVQISNAIIRNHSFIKGNAIINDRCVDNATIGKCGFISSHSNYIVIGPIGSRKDYTTFYETGTSDIYVSCGCFNDSIHEFKNRVQIVHDSNEYGREYDIAINTAINILKKNEVK